MRNIAIIGLLVASSLALNGCGQQNSPTEGQSAPSASNSVTSTSSVMLFNAYTSKELDTNNNAGVPTRDFTPSDKVYVGVVVHGEADTAHIRIDWSLANGAALGNAETSVPVVKAAVATFDLSKEAPLKAGSYKVLVSLNGKPGWELNFVVR